MDSAVESGGVGPMLTSGLFRWGKQYAKERPLLETDVSSILEYRQEGKSTGWIARELRLDQVRVARVLRDWEKSKNGR